MVRHGVTRRQAHQQNRILHGVASGRLTAGETFHLERREGAIHREAHIMRAVNGGKLTGFDRHVLRHQLNRTSAMIWLCICASMLPRVPSRRRFTALIAQSYSPNVYLVSFGNVDVVPPGTIRSA